MGQRGRIKKDRNSVKGVAVKKKDKNNNIKTVEKYYGNTQVITYKNNNKKGRGQRI